MFKLFNNIWNSEKLPDNFGLAIIIPIPKGPQSNKNGECSDFRTITVINHSMKLLLSIILSKIQPILEQQINPFQFGFRQGKSTIGAILTLKLLAEKYVEKDLNLYTAFIDFQKAFDRVPHNMLFDILQEYNIPVKIVSVLKNIYGQTKGIILWKKLLSKPIPIDIGVHQGDPLSPVLFIAFLNKIMRETNIKGIKISTCNVIYKYIAYADDVAILAEDYKGLQNSLNSLTKVAKRYNMLININKTKVLVFRKKGRELIVPYPLKIDGKSIDFVDKFKYLGRELTSYNDDADAIKQRINLARAKTYNILKFLTSSKVNTKTKLRIIHVSVFTVMSYASETWAIKKADMNKINGFENKLYRLILAIHWDDMISNEKIYEMIDRKERLLQKLFSRKLAFIGNVCQEAGPTVYPLFIFHLPGKNPLGACPLRYTSFINKYIEDPNLSMACDGTLWETTSEHIITMMFQNIRSKKIKDDEKEEREEQDDENISD